ncbi:germination protein YpeB [Jeotgalibacillus proteolyticus]|uniref:Germination protein YpeB n=1 Tax=Jeotgalibacillus proteolyticus TaxID=2082395 RepID=A0A2S5GE70_9BACL|nr:germination protein YpeB [Jeotgalibacillus proteolyticus]PPA71279.1 germination protein YpeB [Jeotgalibacillus proteolyticus]
MKRTLLFSILFIGLFSAVSWGAYQQQEKQTLRNHMENQYQQAFHEMNYQMDLLHDQIGGTLAMNAGKNLTPALTEVWRLTSLIHADIGQLPLGLLPFNEMEDFLTKVGNFSYQAAVRDLEASPLNEEEYKKLETLYSQSEDLQKELRNIQSKVLADNLEWIEIENLLATGDEVKNNAVIDGFKGVDSSVKGYALETFEPTEQESVQERRKTLSHLTGEDLTEEQAMQKAKEFAQVDEDVQMDISKSLDGSDYPFYSVSWETAEGNAVNMDLTVKGGYPLYFLTDREITQEKVSLYDAGEKAAQFLKEQGYNDVVLESSRQEDGIAMLTFIRLLKPQDIYVNSDAIHMKVALDNGDIIGFLGMDYLQNGEEREVGEVTISEEEAIKLLHSNFTVQESRLAIISNELGDEVLCREFIGTLGDDTFRIFINGQTGQEEKVEKL